MSENNDKKEEVKREIPNQHLADKIAGKVDENNEPIETPTEDAPAEKPAVDQNEHLAKIHENDNVEGKTTVSGESESEAPAPLNPEADLKSDNPETDPETETETAPGPETETETEETVETPGTEEEE